MPTYANRCLSTRQTSQSLPPMPQSLPLDIPRYTTIPHLIWPRPQQEVARTEITRQPPVSLLSLCMHPQLLSPDMAEPQVLVLQAHTIALINPKSPSLLARIGGPLRLIPVEGSPHFLHLRLMAYLRPVPRQRRESSISHHHQQSACHLLRMGSMELPG
jgi:hypothetical protein